MNILRAKYEIQTPISEGGIEELKLIEKVARTCYKSEDKITDDGESAKKIVSNLLNVGHEAMLEHSFLSVRFWIDRAIATEVVRHRLFSFAQESTRYVNYSKEKYGNEINVIDITPCIDNDPKMKNVDSDSLGGLYVEWLNAMKDAEEHYMNMIAYGASPQTARSVLPNSTKTELNVSGNYREWRHFFKLRCDKAAHPQVREVAIPLLKELQRRIPIIFDDILVDEDFKLPGEETNEKE